MVMERPIRGVALGGASVGVGAVCQTAADHLAADRDVLASVWLERGGRLRCVAGTGDWPRRDGISPTAGVVGATFAAGVENVVAASPAESANGPHAGAAVESEVCLPIRCDGCVAGILDIRLTRPIEDGDVERFRRAADDLGREIAALGGPPAESAAQRMLRHMTSLSALDEPDAIARAVLAAALGLMEVDSAALLRRDAGGAEIGGTEEATAPAKATTPTPTAPTPTTPTPTAAVATLGPLGPALAEIPPHALDAIARAADDGIASVVIGTRGDLARPELQTLRAAGARSLIAVGLVANAESRGLLLLAGRAERPVSIDDIELLELLAAHAATCLRTADLMRSLRERAATDPLTGLGHHATFHEMLARAHRRPRTAVVLLDLDGFKRINDTFGHQHGDQVLRAIADALTGALRRGDTLFRIGGDEFAALLAVSDPEEALEAGTRLRDAVAAADLGVTVSIGVAVPRRGEADATLLARADRALYRVKESGRDGVAIADPEPLPLLPPL
jgi:diguanylate cyclase (GGDEF)-like protein